ncbi:MAG: sulfatase, partial [Verrucomicrobia bacterium]|nr:sulfatase [Verrucomicrobiota bacterium]
NQGGEPSSIMREGDWKLIYYHEDGRCELYHLPEDLGEQNDVASDHKDKVQSMFQKLVSWLQETDARMPFLNPKFDDERHRKQQIQTRTRTLTALEREHAAVLQPGYEPRGGWWENRGK